MAEVSAFRNRALYRTLDHPPADGIDPDIVAECVPLWRACWERAIRSGEKPGGNQKGRSVPLMSPDETLRFYGITFERDRKLWASYERAIRRAAQGGTV